MNYHFEIGGRRHPDGTLEILEVSLCSGPEPPLKEVRVLVSALNTYQFFLIHEQRLRQFCSQVLQHHSQPKPEENLSQGIAGAAAIGISCIFPRIPPKFPAIDLLRHLQSDAQTVLGEPVSESEIHWNLIRFGSEHNMLAGDGTEQ